MSLFILEIDMMSLVGTIGFDIGAILINLIIIFLTTRNRFISSKKILQRNAAVTVIMVLTIVEIIEFILENSNNAKFVTLDIVLNSVYFFLGSLAIVFTAMVIKSNETNPKILFWFLIPIIINGIMIISNLFTGYYFTVTGATIYQRGDFFYIYTLCIMFELVIIGFMGAKSRKNADFIDRFSVFIPLGIIVLAFTLQSLASDIACGWWGAATALLVYFFLEDELTFKYDHLSKLKTRNSYQFELDSLNKSKNYTIISLDINNLKYVNDTLGHLEGDTYISEVGRLILKSFSPKGSCFRIGGDEFSVIYTNTEEKEVVEALNYFQMLIDEHPNIGDKKFEVAYGYSRVETNENIDNPLNYINIADKNMFINKQSKKEKQISDRNLGK